VAHFSLQDGGGAGPQGLNEWLGAVSSGLSGQVKQGSGDEGVEGLGNMAHFEHKKHFLTWIIPYFH